VAARAAVGRKRRVFAGRPAQERRGGHAPGLPGLLDVSRSVADGGVATIVLRYGTVSSASVAAVVTRRTVVILLARDARATLRRRNNERPYDRGYGDHPKYES
jgi:hypothetical protein